MSARLTGIVFASVLLFAVGTVSTAEAQLLGSRPLAVPITGSVVGGGNFVGTLSISRFAVSGSTTVAVGAIAGAIVDSPAGVSAVTGMRANIVLPVTVNGIAPIAMRSRAADAPRVVLAQCGSDVRIQVGAGTAVNVMGNQVMLNPAVLDVNAASGGLIGSLVCQVLGVLGNPTSVVGILNQLLPQLVGLIGGLGGGLLL